MDYLMEMPQMDGILLDEWMDGNATDLWIWIWQRCICIDKYGWMRQGGYSQMMDGCGRDGYAQMNMDGCGRDGYAQMNMDIVLD